MLKVNIPNKLKVPKHRNSLIINERGWVDKDTGEIIMRVNGLAEELEKFFTELKKETNTLLKTYQDIFDDSGIEVKVRAAGRPKNRTTDNNNNDNPEEKDASNQE